LDKPKAENKLIVKAVTVKTPTPKPVPKPAPPSDSIVQVLTGIRLLKGLKPDELKKIATHCRYRRFSAHDQIFDRNSSTSDVFFVVRGRVRIVNYSLSGREITLDDVTQGDHFGELSAIDGEPRSAGVRSMTDSLIVALPRADFLEAVGNYPAMALNIMKSMAKIIRISTERIMDLSTLGANNRVHADLLRQALACKGEGNEAKINPMPVHGEIAARVSTTRETVARVMNELARKNIIERKKDILVVRDIERLRDMVEAVRGD